MTATQHVSGNCLCGAIQFTANGPSKWCAHCHCNLCRLAHGAGYVTWVGYESAQVQVTRGESQLKWYASSKGAQRGFCKTCGSSLFFRSERWAGELHIALANIKGKIDRPPQANVFFDTHVDWMPVDSTLRQIDG